MSKSEAPAPQGQPQHAPKIRVHGVEEGSPKYQAVVDQLAGQIGQFHRSQQQLVALSGNTEYASHTRVPGARLRYRNSQGQETVTVHVDEIPEPEPEEESPSGKPWDFALIDLHMDNLGDGNVFLVAAFTKPTTKEQKAATLSTPLPIPGITARDYDSEENAIIEFAGDYGHDATKIHDESGSYTSLTRSLKVDLRKYPNTTVEVDLYGWVEPYLRQGGTGAGADFCVSSTLIGSVTYDFSGIKDTHWTPSTVAGCPKVFFWQASYPLTVPGIYNMVIDTFPELAGFTAKADPIPITGGIGYGDDQVGMAWSAYSGIPPFYFRPADYTTSWGSSFFERPTDASPDTDPNSWVLRTPVAPGSQLRNDGTNFEDYAIYEFWDGSIKKRSTIDCCIFYGPTDTTGDHYGHVGSVPAGPFDSPPQANVANGYQVRYYLPTWQYSGNAPFTLKGVMVQGGNPWKFYARKINSKGSNHTFTFETKDYPKRPSMKDLGGGLAAKKPAVVSGSPSEHFKAPRLGTLKIDTRHGSIKWEAA